MEAFKRQVGLFAPFEGTSSYHALWAWLVICGEAYMLDGSKESEIVEVKAYSRKIIRCCMKKGCSCKWVPNTITAPMPPKVIPKSPYGISVWEAVLLNKFRYCQPTNRLANQYAELGLPISPGSIAGGLKMAQPELVYV